MDQRSAGCAVSYAGYMSLLSVKIICNFTLWRPSLAKYAVRRSLLYTGPGRDDDTTWEQRTGGVEGPVIAALRPLNLNLVRGKACPPCVVNHGLVTEVCFIQSSSCCMHTYWQCRLSSFDWHALIFWHWEPDIRCLSSRLCAGT